MLNLRASIGMAAMAWALAFGYSAADAKPKVASARKVDTSSPNERTRGSTGEAHAAALKESYRLEANGDCKAAAAAIERAGTGQSYFLAVRLAYLQLCAKDFARAANSYGQAAAMDGTGIEALLGQQQALLALPRYKEALQVGEEIIQRDGNNYLGNSRLAWTLFNLKQYSRAVAAYERLVKLYPADVEMRLGLAWAQLRAGKRAAAAEHFRAVLDMVPDNARAREGIRVAVGE